MTTYKHIQELRAINWNERRQIAVELAITMTELPEDEAAFDEMIRVTRPS